MKVSISDIAWDIMDDEEMLEFLQENHFDLEIAPTKIVPETPYQNLKRAKEYKDKLEQKNIQVSSMQSIWFGKTENIFESEENRRILIEYTKEAILQLSWDVKI